MLLTARVREPLQHYLSAYLWATSGKPSKGLSKARAHAVHARSSSSSLRGNASVEGVRYGLDAGGSPTTAGSAARRPQHARHERTEGGATPAAAWGQGVWHAAPAKPSFVAWVTAAPNLQARCRTVTDPTCRKARLNAARLCSVPRRPTQHRATARRDRLGVSSDARRLTSLDAQQYTFTFMPNLTARYIPLHAQLDISLRTATRPI